ncbi:MAG TPA: DUF1269 domain-containing protein [Solirubrobacteraceae bacterium]|jgi:uncharacterized membrane protein|nr:DUF1269 domain-containing protein [Solirubrobacteraceae bacterium]
MATLTVWKFPTASGADEAVRTLEQLQTQELIKVHDAAVVSWPADKKKPRTNQLHSLVGTGALGGAFWGLLFGLIFFVPFFGLAIGAAAGAIGGSFADVGIDDDFIKRVREQVTPGTSALFALTSDAVMDRVREAFGDFKAELLETNLSSADEAKLREVFAED